MSDEDFYRDYFNPPEPTRWQYFVWRLRVRYIRVRYFVVRRCENCSKRMWFTPIEECCCCEKCYDDWISF